MTEEEQKKLISTNARTCRALDALEVLVHYRRNTFCCVSVDGNALSCAERLIESVYSCTDTPDEVKKDLEACFPISSLEQ